jgi:hypothetical protein
MTPQTGAELDMVEIWSGFSLAMTKGHFSARFVLHSVEIKSPYGTRVGNLVRRLQSLWLRIKT